jgi:hypothetical protein
MTLPLKNPLPLLADNPAAILPNLALDDKAAPAESDQMAGRNGSIKNALVVELPEGCQKHFREIFGHE